jgi:NAD(P)-dependent dehydrogenase (short-subunit alcohol dehydrogenase family)
MPPSSRPRSRWSGSTGKQWDEVLGVNLTGAVSTLVAALPHVVDGGALLVSGSSMAIRPREHRLADVAAKAGPPVASSPNRPSTRAIR